MTNIFVSLIIALLSHCSLVFSSGIPGPDLPKHMVSGYMNLQLSSRDHFKRKLDLARSQLSENLKDVVPDELILTSGFLGAKDFSPLEMAGCYIRLGQHFRHYEDLEDRHRFASLSFFNAGSAYAKLARTLSGQEVNMDVKEIRINFLVSTAQCYYWAVCNEPNLRKKAIERGLVIDYLGYARDDTNLLTGETKAFWFNKIDVEYAKLL